MGSDVHYRLGEQIQKSLAKLEDLKNPPKPKKTKREQVAAKISQKQKKLVRRYQRKAKKASSKKPVQEKEVSLKEMCELQKKLIRKLRAKKEKKEKKAEPAYIPPPIRKLEPEAYETVKQGMNFLRNYDKRFSNKANKGVQYLKWP